MNPQLRPHLRTEGADKRALLRTLMGLAVPVALQSLLGFAVNLIDTLMLGTLGEVQISAAALGGQPFFILSLLIFGLVGGSNVMVAQYYGRGDRDAVNHVLAYTYRMALGLALLVTVVGLFFPRQMLSLFSKDEQVIAEGAQYLRTIAVSYLFYTITTTTTGTLRAVRNVGLSMLLSAVALVINALLNWVLIFGNLGAPRLGVQGAAVASVVARGVELVLLLWYMVRKEERLCLSLRKLLRLDKSMGKIYFAHVVPVIFNELFWSVGASVLTMIIGRMGTQFVTANSIFGVVSQIAGVVGSGMAAATAVMVGNTIGQGDYGKLRTLVRMLQVLGLVAGVATAGVILLLRPAVLMLYNISDSTLYYTNQIMVVGAAVQMIRTAQNINTMGILRGAGDAKFVLVNDLVFLWLLAVPLGFLAGLVWEWPIPVVFCLLNIEQIFKWVLSTVRLRGDKWIKNVAAPAQE